MIPQTPPAGNPSDGPSPEWTRHPQDTFPTMEDTFTRAQVVAYLEEIPLGYDTSAEHYALDRFVSRAQRHFLQLDNQWQPSID